MVAVPKGVPWFPDDVEGWSVRWILLRDGRTGRHAGHAALREAIDGATMHQLMATVEDWPDSRGSQVAAGDQQLMDRQLIDGSRPGAAGHRDGCVRSVTVAPRGH
jgi:hypothetical protein